MHCGHVRLGKRWCKPLTMAMQWPSTAYRSVANRSSSLLDTQGIDPPQQDVIRCPFLVPILAASMAKLAARCAGGTPTPDQILAAALQRRGLLQRCVLEALRLRGAGVTVRMAMSDLELPKGDGRMLSVRKVSCSARAGTCKSSEHSRQGGGHTAAQSSAAATHGSAAVCGRVTC